MNAKRYLNQLQYLDSKINNKIEQLNDLKFTLNCIGNGRALEWAVGVGIL